MENTNIIAAYSGGSLPAAIAIVRMSGEGCIGLLGKIFRPKSGKPMTECKNNTMIYGGLSACDGRTIDICLACVYRAPHSYTGEDMAEIFCHGSEAVVSAALRSIFAAGGRQAEAGEFTKRAFLNGKLDLAGAEAVADLIYSRTEQGAKNAAALLRGDSFRELEAMREELTGLIAHFYAVCDYSDEEIEPFEYQAAREKLGGFRARLEHLYEGYLRSDQLRDGLPVAVVGRPNAGKSSIFNRLAGFERAIVTDEAGTTRDVVGQRVTLKGRDFSLMDTAGLRMGQSRAEQLGIDRSRRAAEEAGLVMAVFDGSRPFDDEDRETIELCRGKKAAAIINKCDAEQLFDEGRLEGAFDKILHISALTGEGLEGLISWLTESAPDMTEVLITSQRQAELIHRASLALAEAERSAGEGMTADAFLLDAEQAARLIGQVMGSDVDIDIAQGIFSRFCVGK